MKGKSVKNLCFVALSLLSLCFFSSVQAQPMQPPDVEPDPALKLPPGLPPVDFFPSPTAPTSPQKGAESAISTLVSCKNSGGVFTTVAEQGDSNAVLFTWKTTEFGTEFTPEKRCQIVSNKFNGFVQENGSTFKNLVLTEGVVRGFPVICINTPSDNSCQVLFTLRKENRDRAKKIILSLKNPDNLAPGGINESGSRKARSLFVNLGEWSKRKLSNK